MGALSIDHPLKGAACFRVRFTEYGDKPEDGGRTDGLDGQIVTELQIAPQPVSNL